MSHKAPVVGLPPVFVHEYAKALPLAGEVNWGMVAFAIDQLRSVSDGTGVKIGIVDTGVDRDHPLLRDKVVDAKDFTGSSSGYNDRNGHGTHCTATVGGADPRIGVATGSPLYHGKGLNDRGSGGEGLIDANDWCFEQGCEITSNSWGGGTDDDWIRRFKVWAEKGYWPIFAGGNSGPNTPNADEPGVSEHLINVAALSSNFAPASFSSAGEKLDTSGPGVDIWSAKPGGGYARMSGTSMATPFVAGMLGLYRAGLKKRGMKIPNVYELRDLLFRSSTDTHTPGDDRRTGPGWITPMLLSLNLNPDPPKVGGASGVC